MKRKIVGRVAISCVLAIGLILMTAMGCSEERKIVINTDTSDPKPKAAFEKLIEEFEKAYPEIKVEWNLFDHEGYKTSIRNFLTADAPDLANWYAGNRMAPFVEAGLFEDVTDVWEENDLNNQLSSSAPSMTIDGKKWGVPYTYYQWGIYYRKDLFEQVGAKEPKTWKEFLEVCAKLKAAGITPFTIGTKALWPVAGWFDYLNMRVNGYKYHMDLTSGKRSYADREVSAVFDRWDELVKNGYFIEDHAAIDWQEAVPHLVNGKAAMYLMGNFAVAVFVDGGVDKDNLGFFSFPKIADVPRAEDAPIDTIHIPSNAKNKEDAKLFLAFLAKAETQTMMNDILGQLPVNSGSEVTDDPFLQIGFEMLSTAKGIAQFYDRDAPAEMAKAGMEGFQEYMVNPDRRDEILNRLVETEKRVYEK